MKEPTEAQLRVLHVIVREPGITSWKIASYLRVTRNDVWQKIVALRRKQCLISPPKQTIGTNYATELGKRYVGKDCLLITPEKCARCGAETFDVDSPCFPCKLQRAS